MTRGIGSERMRTISMFAGIGGIDLGLERTGGFKTVAVAEIDPFGSRVLAKHFPDAVNIGDVTTAEFPDADFICAGFPCQDISFAGQGAGLAGARSGLWREVVRALRMVRPRGALLENVAALLNRGLDRVLGDMAEIGYDAEWHCIPASAVGAPHRRDRIWIIANPGSEQHEGCRPPISGQIAAQLPRAFTDTAPMLGQEVVGPEPDGDQPSFGAVADAQGEYEYGRRRGTEPSGWREPSDGSWWAAEPDVDRVAHGISQRVDRLRALGNSVVPQIPEMIGKAILAAEAGLAA